MMIEEETQNSNTKQEQVSVNNQNDNETQVNNQCVKYLTFLSSGEVYGAEVNSIKEIIEYGNITRVPLTPQYLRGVINLRGNVVPVVDLAVRLGKTENDIGKRTSIIIVEMKSSDEEIMDIGFVVDEVEEVLDISSDLVTAAPQFGTEIRADFIFGMVQLKNKFVILLQLHEVLSIVELAALVDLENAD